MANWLMKDLATVNTAAKKQKMSDNTPFGDEQFSEAEKASASGCASVILFASLGLSAACLLILLAWS